MEEKTFYDIHLHAFNLSHPYLRAFVRRMNISNYLVLMPFISWLLPLAVKLKCVKKKVANVANLLAVMEDDIDSVFLLLENCLRENKLLDNDGLHIGKETYKKVVLTPLIIDFGYKRLMGGKDVHYNHPCRKPIRRQVIDVFSALTYYRNFVYSDKYKIGFPHLKPDDKGRPTARIFEIYPFIGINPANYTYNELVELMEKYFGDYKGTRQALNERSLKIDNDIEHLSSNCAAGVKLYPPLGFDPWPPENAKDERLKKTRYLYDFCEKKGIPITVHGSESGFNVLSNKRRKELTNINKWRTVLKEYQNLKLNLAHFPVNEKKFFFFPKTARLKQVLGLLKNEKNQNLYVDFSCRAVNDGYYKALKKLIDQSEPEVKERLKNRIMFGTDFSINLLAIESYNAYYRVFDDTRAFDKTEKSRFCSANPESFLFNKA